MEITKILSVVAKVLSKEYKDFWNSKTLIDKVHFLASAALLGVGIAFAITPIPYSINAMKWICLGVSLVTMSAAPLVVSAFSRASKRLLPSL